MYGLLLYELIRNLLFHIIIIINILHLNLIKFTAHKI